MEKESGKLKLGMCWDWWKKAKCKKKSSFKYVRIKEKIKHILNLFWEKYVCSVRIRKEQNQKAPWSLRLTETWLGNIYLLWMSLNI